jgi:hypothetical protein
MALGYESETNEYGHDASFQPRQGLHLTIIGSLREGLGFFVLF